MNSIWSWDNCFSALAVARANPQLAWDQLLLFFEHLDPHGIAPDQINDLYQHYSFTKPPIQGWTIVKLVAQLGLTQSLPYLSQLYEPMCRLTDWWYTMRDFDGDGVCQYHHGNDSGWDNATAFDQGYPTEAADLSAHLVLQCEGLAFMADALGKPLDAQRWRARAEKQLADLVRHGGNGSRFISPLDGRHDAPECQSLLNTIPMELGHRLPPDVRRALIADLQPGGAFLTDYGLATESPASQKYEANGYWRGPIWAPSTYQIFDGLVDAGETALARTVAERFCDMCVRAPGFWENYDALTGEGLCCPGYSWTAAVFLLLAEWLGRQS
jgi:glycogen debranching enzyme